MQYDNVLDDAINRMINTHRTCGNKLFISSRFYVADLMLGVGDGKTNEFRGFQYSYSVLNVFDDQNLMPYNETWHPRINDIVYWGMDW